MVEYILGYLSSSDFAVNPVHQTDGEENTYSPLLLSSEFFVWD